MVKLARAAGTVVMEDMTRRSMNGRRDQEGEGDERDERVRW
jgi:hypothetical protein